MSELARLARRAVALVRERASAGARDTLRSARDAASWTWLRRPAGPRAAALAFAAAIALTGVWALVAQVRLAHRLPSPLDWAAARALVERDIRRGDAAAVAPAWAERARELLPSSIPVLAYRRFEGEDLVGVRRVWLLSIPRAPGFRWEAEVDLLERAARSEAPARLGAFEVTRYDVASPNLPLAFLPDRLAHAAVTLGGAPCSAPVPGTFRCADGAVEISRAVRDVGGVPRPCLSATAASALDAPVVVTFAPTRIGRTLEGHASGDASSLAPGDTSSLPPGDTSSLAPGASRGRGSGRGGSAAPAPIRIAVLLDGEEIGAAELPGTGWSRFRIDMARSAGQSRAISLVLTSPGRLSLCLDALVLP